MTRVAMFLLLAGSVLAIEPPARKPNTVELNGHVFTLPDGFTIELAGGTPLVNRPISATFDEQGHLYVTDSSGTNDKVQVQLEQKPHRVLKLTDTKGSGKFDKSTVFVDKLMFPEGAMWLDGSLYVAAPPSIWKLTDTTGNGIADKREEWFKGQTLTGCANDLHGPYRGPDGWIYWCKGAFAKQTYERPGKPPFVTRAAHIFRARPDGSGIEPVITGGMDNPVGLAFTPGGEIICCGTFFQHPAGGHRDGLIHAVYGGVYGKDHDVVYEHPWTGPNLMPIMTHLGPAAPAALIRYESNAFGPEYKDNLFCALFNLHKVTRHVLIPAGATFSTRDEDFVVSNNVDFHPTDVIEDTDGSLLIIDTGGWYKLCCPTSQFHKPDVLGAIYRVRRKDVITVLDGRELDIAARRKAVWAAGRSDGPDARSAVRSALWDPDETVSLIAIHASGLHRDKQAVVPLRGLLAKGTPHMQRAAAEALGHIGNNSAIPDLYFKLGFVSGRILEHSLTYALIEIGDQQSVAAGLKSDGAQIRRAALTALDQMPGSKIEAGTVIAELNAASRNLRETAWWIVGHHPEWGEQLVGVLRERIGGKLSPDEQTELTRQLAKLAKSSAIQQFLADQILNPSARSIVLHAILQANLRPAPDAWVSALTRSLTNGDEGQLRDVVRTVRGLSIPRPKAIALTHALLTVADRADLPAEVRLYALAAIPGGPTDLSQPFFDFVRNQLRPDCSATVRTSAADVLSKSKLNESQLLALCDAVKDAGPLEAERLLDAFSDSTDDTVGRALVSALTTSKRNGLRVAALRPRLAKFGPAVQKHAEQLYAVLSVNDAQQKAKLEKLLTTLGEGDVRRGQTVFHSQKAACSTCHAVGYVGGTLGPDLTKIGSIRTDRDLLESIVFPSASFVRSYEPVLVSTKDTAEEVVVATGADQEVHVSRSDLDEIQPSTVSVMPAGLDQILTTRELADLIAFLKACK
jgi:putative membrane-bound dehydrogenase-like protein